MDKARIQELRQFYHRQLMEDVLPFWMQSDLLDREYGGYITTLDFKKATTEKSRFCRHSSPVSKENT